MGKQSKKENKNIYQEYRERVHLTREKASEQMDGVSSAKIEKIEYNQQQPSPYDVVQMSKCYKEPSLCNFYCSHECEIGKKYVPEIKVSELTHIILETVASLNDVEPLTKRLIEIARDGKITDDEIKDFALITKKLEEVSIAIESLQLWVEKTASENNINMALLEEELKKLENN